MTQTRSDHKRTYPEMAAAKDRVEPAPRRVRGFVADRVVLDTTRAVYVWEAPYYPQYYVPLDDVDSSLLIDAGREQHLRLGTARSYHLQVGEVRRDGAARVYGNDAINGLAGHARFQWGALDAWFEEDEEIFVHPRNPYVRVDALRSRRRLRVELDGMLLASSDRPVLVFETGLPTRYYVDRTDVTFDHLVLTDTETSCPYKGKTDQYWSVRTPNGLHEDLAWSYRFTTDALRAIAGLVAFYDEKVDVFLDGTRLERPSTKFS